MKRNVKRESSAQEEVSREAAVQAPSGLCRPSPNHAVPECPFGAPYAEGGGASVIRRPFSGVDPANAAIKFGKMKRRFRAQREPPPAAPDQPRVDAPEGGVSAETGMFLRHPHLGLDPARLQAFELLNTAQLMSMGMGIAELMVIRFGKYGLPYSSARPLVVDAGTLSANALRVNAFGRDVIGPALDDLIAIEYTFQRRVDAATEHLNRQVSTLDLSEHVWKLQLFGDCCMQGAGD